MNLLDRLVRGVEEYPGETFLVGCGFLTLVSIYQNFKHWCQTQVLDLPEPTIDPERDFIKVKYRFRKTGSLTSYNDTLVLQAGNLESLRSEFVREPLTTLQRYVNTSLFEEVSILAVIDSVGSCDTLLLQSVANYFNLNSTKEPDLRHLILNHLENQTLSADYYQSCTDI